jgi:hypothetical protein
MNSKEMGSYKASRSFIICFCLTAATKCSPWKKLSWGPRKHFVAKKVKNGSVQTQGDSSPFTKLAKYRENISKLQQARQRLMAVGRQAFSFVT